MQCMNCATELLHPANFCPVCGARLAAPAPDGSAATLPGGTTPAVVAVPDTPREQNVLYLSEHDSSAAGSAANPRSHEYEGARAPTPVEQPEPAGPPPPAARPLHPLGVDPIDARREYVRARAAQVEAALPAFGSHGPTPQPHELVPPPRDPDNPFGDFFGDGPSAWLEDDDDSQSEHESGESRLLGTLLASGSVAMLFAAWAIWGVAIYRGAGGAEAGGFIMLGSMLWVLYLSQPRVRQHRFMLRRHARVQGFVDRRTGGIRERTEVQLSMRRERERYRAMRDERTRRVNALGEGAYRGFRQGQLPADLHAGAQRILAMERQMLIQDQRIQVLDANRQSRREGSPSSVAESAGDRGSDPAAPPPQGGQPRS